MNGEYSRAKSHCTEANRGVNQSAEKIAVVCQFLKKLNANRSFGVHPEWEFVRYLSIFPSF
jgi:hypothetical protein